MELTSGGRQVIVESADPLDVVEAKVRELWPLTAVGGREGDTIGFGMAAAGLVGEPVGDGQLLMPAEIATPSHLIPWQEAPDDRR